MNDPTMNFSNPFHLKFNLVASLLLLLAVHVWAQPSLVPPQLNITPENSSNLMGEELEGRIFTQTAEPVVRELIIEILQTMEVSGATFDIEVADVPTVLAYTKDNVQKLLYNPGFLVGIRTLEGYDWYRLGHLGHAIGHLYYRHDLGIGENRQVQELEADAFNGNMLAKLGATKEQALSVLDQYDLETATDYYPAKADRIAAFLAGWEAYQLKKSRAAAMSEAEAPTTPTIMAVPKGPAPKPDYETVSFPFPPPKASASQILPTMYFEDAKNLGDVDRVLSSAIGGVGYTEKSYYYVPDGFALVTRLEQINQDASSMPPPDRWSANLLPLRRFSLVDYLNALFMGKKGTFRVFVFVVTPYPFSQTSEAPTKPEAQEWLDSGYNVLPPQLAQKEYTYEYNVTALIYEFELVENGESHFIENSNHSSQTHLEKSRIISQLRK
ncbi:MAG: hypothetical protein KDC44_02420 [Phaeodactylibacter sp.]|nr:hypothetical protein [Phaeodactylibacter sp.]